MEDQMPKPTPTQEENDKAALGEHVLQKEDDGSGPDLFAEANEQARAQQVKHMEAGKPATYQTRQAQARAPTKEG
jgi:hypothetical protein